MLSEGRQSRSIGILATVMALVMGLAISGGCASSGDEGATASGSDESYPNLGDVPDRPVTMTEQQREQLEKGLVADSQQRAYSEEVIAFQSEPAEPLPAPMETGAGGAAASSLGDVVMPGAVTPPFSGMPATPSAAPTASTASKAPAPSTAPTAPAPTTASMSSTPATAVPTATPATAATAPAPSNAVTAATAAAAAQAAPPTIPVPPEDPLARATTPPFSGSSSSVPAPAVPPGPATSSTSAPPTALYTPPPARHTPPSAPYTPPSAPSAPYTPPSSSYAPVPSAPAALPDDSSTANLNRGQLDDLQPSRPPFSGTTGAPAGSDAPPQAAGPPAGTYPPPPATPAYAPSPAGVQEVFEARLQDSLPSTPSEPLPSTGDLEGDEPLTTVVVSSSGVATFDELPVNVPVLEREPVPDIGPGGQRGSLARKAVPSDSVKVATILFNDGSSELQDREREIVRAVYERYLSSGRKVRVVGHSSSRTRNMDPVRHRMVNFGISAERANAVAVELQNLGVSSDQITVVAASDDMPMYYEVMPSGEAGNRRVEIYLD